MDIRLEVYFKRLTDALEKVIAPEIESDHVRGQTFALIDLIRQLVDRVEYKQNFMKQEIEMSSETIRIIVRAVEEAGIDAPGELKTFLKELDEGGAGRGISLLDKTDEMLCAAIDLIHENRGAIGKYEDIDKQIRDHLFKIAGRYLGLMKPPMIERISRPEPRKGA